MNTDCVFCKLLAGELEVSLVQRDDLCSAFLDIQPVTPGHTLVIPNRHAPSLAELNDDEGSHMFVIGRRIASALTRSGVKCEGVNFFLADGEAAGQEVFHVHLHVFPRFAGDGFGLKLPAGYEDLPARTDLNEIAKRLRELC